MTRFHPIQVALAAILVAGCGPSQVQSGPCSQHADCDDGNPCTDDRCSPDGRCITAGNLCPCEEDSECAAFDDADLCNGSLVCDRDKGCVIDPATVVVCSSDQDTDCLENQCDPTTGACQMTPVVAGTVCDDGDDCTGGDRCRAGACVGAEETCCDDRVNNDGDDAADCDDPDCAALAVCDDACPAIEPGEASPLPVQSASNRLETTAVNSFTDDYVYNQAGTLKLGTRREWGGTIVFFGTDNGSPGLNNSNAIDAADTGREVQVALYDVDRWYQSCAWNASCNANPSPTVCPQEMTWLGWNPVQGGNRCNNGSGVDDVLLADGAISVETTPLFWNPNWDRTDCNSDACGNPSVNRRRSDVQVHQRVRFVRPNVVELSYRVVNLAGTDHPSSAHEFPTVYSAFGKNGTPDLHRLFDSRQQEIAIDDHPPTDATFRYKNFSSTGGWVSLQNSSLDYGVGLYYENGMSRFQAWQADDPDFNNFRGLFSFAIPGFGEVRARSYLILGSLATVASEAQWLTENLAPFGSLDAPASGDALSGTVQVHGWAMDNRGVAAVDLIVDGGAPIPLSYGSSRPDVCRVWPGYPACANGKVGYAGSFDASGLTPSECGHIFEIRATDGDGNARVIARRRLFLAP